MAITRSSRNRSSLSRAGRSARGRGPARVSRSGMVWGAFLAAMLTVGGGLYLADSGRLDSARSGGITPMLATTPTGGMTDAAGSGGGLDAILRTTNPVQGGRWQAIVIHDSGDLVGTPVRMDEQARARGLRGLGHHFVIGNGGGMADGELFVSQRWMDQTHGAHAAGVNADWFNRNAVGICLVGDGNRRRFSAAQATRLHEVVRLLCQRLSIPADRVYLHSQIAPTSSPGRLFSEASLRQALLGAGGR